MGQTGSGKTFLVSKLVATRQYVIVVRTKPDDIKFPGFEVSKIAESMEHWYAERILLEPKLHLQAREIWRALQKAWKHGGWTVAIDELWYLEHKLGLKEYVENLLTQGRSKKLSIMVGMQRPAQVSRFSLSECTHFFVFRCEGRDRKTILESTTDSDEMKQALASITGHDFVYFNRKHHIVALGNANNIESIFKNTSRK